MENLVADDPFWLLALLILPIIAWLRGRRAAVAIVFPFAGDWKRPSLAGGSRFATALAYLGCSLVIIALARPQFKDLERQSKSRGYDIMLLLDLSSSMLYEDYKDGIQSINRLQAVKPVLTAFITGRSSDRIGLVAFSGRAYTVAPLTFDHQWLARQTDRLTPGLIEDGTAIGDAIGVGVARLQEGSKERSGEREGAFAVLLTDGENTAGSLEPMAAAELAAEAGVRVFTVGAGRNGTVIMPVFNDKGNRIGSRRVPSRIDTDTLHEIARVTGGEFFRADNTDTIKNAFQEIDAFSKIEFESIQFTTTTELFPYFATAGGCLLLLAIASGTSIRKESFA